MLCNRIRGDGWEDTYGTGQRATTTMNT